MAHYVSLKVIAAVLCAGVGSLATAHPFLTPISDHPGHHGFQSQKDASELLFALPQSNEGPKLWSEMTHKERAEIWPFLSPRMQRYYWRSMTEQDRRQMRAELSPSINEKFRKRYVSPDHIQPGEHGKVVRHRLTPEERQKMREQIREMHIEFYRFRHSNPPASAADPRVPADQP